MSSDFLDRLAEGSSIEDSESLPVPDRGTVDAGGRPTYLHQIARFVRSPLARGALSSVVLTGLGTGLSYPVQVFVSRTLGVEEYGRYAYVLSIMNVAALVAGLDLGHAALRFMGQYYATGNWPLLRGFLGTSRKLVAGLSMTLGVLGAIVLYFLRPRLSASLFGALLASCILLVPASLMQLELNLVQGLKRVYSPRVPNLIVRPLAFAAALWLMVAIFGARATARNAILANTLGMLTAVAVSMYWLYRAWPHEARQVAPEHRTGEWLRFSSTTLAGSVFYLILSQQSDVIVVGSVVGTRDAGLYSAASQISAIVGMGVVAVTHFASPMIASYYDDRLSSGLRRLVQRLNIFTWCVSVPLVVVLAIGGRLLLRTFGVAFGAAYPVLLIMLAGQTLNALWGALWGVLLTMMGYQREGFVVVIVVATINLLLTIVLTPRFGIVGAAAATLAAVVLRNMIVAWLVHRKLGFWPLLSAI